tara:strand:- start:484 stop:684 length:201 start_codon:yes stop_codon:yes gene_type:complete
MEKTKYIKLKIKAEDYSYISQAFATAIAFYANDRVRNTKEESWKKAEKLAEVAGRVNAAEMEFIRE